jgi:hypothetical protein
MIQKNKVLETILSWLLPATPQLRPVHIDRMLIMRMRRK